MIGRDTAKCIFAFVWFAMTAPMGAATNIVAHVYPGGGQVAVAIGNDLYATLEPKYQEGVNPHAVALEASEIPVIAPIHGNRQVYVSQGFIDLLNHIAHAKAIDRIEPGYFQAYVSALAGANDKESPPAPARLDDAAHWGDAVMNDQASLFNQMISMTLAMNLSHHYLAHCAKHATQMKEGTLEPINKHIEPEEWEDSVRCATLNSLDCALATKGAKALFDCIDQMPHRPAWAAYIVPPDVNIQKLDHEIWRYEHEFFRGTLTLHDRPAAGG